MLIPSAYAQAAGAAAPAGGGLVATIMSFAPLLLVFVAFWFLMIRPAQRRQREVRAMQSSLVTGDEVMLTSGIYGVLRSLDDERVRVELAPGVVVEVARAAVGQKVSPQAESTLSDDADPTTDPTTEER